MPPSASLGMDGLEPEEAEAPAAEEGAAAAGVTGLAGVAGRGDLGLYSSSSLQNPRVEAGRWGPVGGWRASQGAAPRAAEVVAALEVAAAAAATSSSTLALPHRSAEPTRLPPVADAALVVPRFPFVSRAV